MKRRYLTNIVLLIIVILLFWQWRSLSPQVALPDVIAPEIDPDAVKQIRIERADKADVNLTRYDDRWQIEAPFNAPANANRIKFLLNIVTTPFSAKFSIHNQDLATLGLTAPFVRVNLDGALFSFGDVEPLSGQRYLQYQEDVYVFNDTISPLLTANANGLIENHLLFEEPTMTALNLPFRQSDSQLDQQRLTIQASDGTWQSSTVSASVASQLGQAWQNASAIQVNFIDTTSLDASQPIQFHFSDNTSLAAFAHLSSQGLRIFIPERRLQYYFPSRAALALFPALAPTESD
ncbi:hypothetical protein Q7C_1191 [Methylophaga frappieri]|uniref:DUF4340 domain-containing protein n=1 Tax=Methylophaga frappieri (strain ATCC BAA-2434 / DSM 25690 / JAM7) TaxID=754477 RepID=I1YHF1_METFJ|nr:DUF4340 domain-containing protein [Methylophaga frappieri]AFJ02344.1 hypothetical protein Q7C_1191 [Methylophaga frappieri]